MATLPSLVLFDVDGTLIDTAGAGRRSIEQAFRRVLGIDGIETISARVRFEGKTDPTIIREMAHEAGVAEARIAALESDLRAAYLETLRAEMARPDPRRRVLPGVVPLLDDLRPRPAVALGLLTGNIEEGARTKLGPFGLNAYFPTGGFSSDHPDRGEIARIAREKMEVSSGMRFDASRVFVIGDTDHDVACARANGFRAIAVPSGFVSMERIAAAKPDVLLPDLADLPRVLAALALR